MSKSRSPPRDQQSACQKDKIYDFKNRELVDFHWTPTGFNPKERAYSKFLPTNVYTPGFKKVQCRSKKAMQDQLYKNLIGRNLNDMQKQQMFYQEKLRQSMDMDRLSFTLTKFDDSRLVENSADFQSRLRSGSGTRKSSPEKEKPQKAKSSPRSRLNPKSPVSRLKPKSPVKYSQN
jgi:hypothetical protein